MQPRKRAVPGLTPVEATRHADKRVNLPTADAQDFVGPDVSEVRRLRWERDPSLDPQLVWRGKDDVADELAADAPPIYIQEKVDPRVLVENLRRTAAKGADEPEATLFDSFDGLDELDLVDFYRHPANWSNRMILGDSLQVMGSLAERESMRGKVQMIYLDPPLRHQVRLQLAGLHPKARRQGRQARGRRARGRTNKGLPRHLGTGHRLLPHVLARPLGCRA